MAQRRLFGDGTLRWGLEAGDGAAATVNVRAQLRVLAGVHGASRPGMAQPSLPASTASMPRPCRGGRGSRRPDRPCARRPGSPLDPGGGGQHRAVARAAHCSGKVEPRSGAAKSKSLAPPPLERLRRCQVTVPLLNGVRVSGDGAAAQRCEGVR